MTLRSLLAPVSTLSLGLLLAGCGQQASTVKTALATKGVSGRVHGGQNPVTGATIQLWQVNTTADGGLGKPLLISTVTSSDGSGIANSNANVGNALNTLPSGDFTITGLYTCPVGDALVYITASGGNPGLIAGTNNPQSQMVTALGSCNNLKSNVQFIEIDEQTTVATVASLYAFMSAYNAIGASPAHAADIAFAFSLMNEYVDFQAATAPGPALPANYSASTGDLNLLANVLATCVNSTGGRDGDGSACGNLFSASTPYPYTTPDADVTAAALSIRKTSVPNTSSVASLASPQAPFEPASTAPPVDWTLPIFQLPPAPTFSLSPGTYAGAQQLRIQDADPSASISYTIGGSLPLDGLAYQGTLTVSSSATVQAVAVAGNGRATSSTASATYTITGNAPAVSVTSTVLTAGSATPLAVQALSNANGSVATFSMSPSVGGSFSPATCTVSSGRCSVMYTPSGTASAGTYTNALTVSFSATGSYTAATAVNSVYVYSPDTLTPFAHTGSVSSLIQASDGDFYGIDQEDGPAFVGQIYKTDLSGNVTTLYSFTGGSDGAFPEDHLVQGTDGYFYGVTLRTKSGGNGTIFRIDSSGNFTLLYSFTGSLDGARPSTALVQGTDGSFYGTASRGGAYGYGTAYKLDSSGNFTVLHAFTGGADGGGPDEILQGADGNFYGTTGGGGTYNAGAVYKMNASGDVTTLYSFTGGSDGDEPPTGLVQGTDGSFYGVTEFGGAFKGGTLFKIDASGNFTSLHSFAGAEGSLPLGTLMQATDGDFYGTTFENGPLGSGTLYKIDSAGDLTLLYGFPDGSGDNVPEAGLIQASDGNFYGAVGANTFKLTPSPALTGPITLTIPISVTHGSPFTLGYTVANAASKTMQQCFATNTAGDLTGWSGIKTASTSATNASLFAPLTPGTYTYTLTCGGVESGFATLNVN